jgi:AcrR family transcriptional regulator
MRRTRLEAKLDTRERLLDAAQRVFVREGFHGATVDMVAAEAGFTKGAVYSAFASKAEMFLALYERRVGRRAAAMRRQAAGTAAGDVPVEMWREWSRTMRADRAWHLLLIEFWVFAARDPELRARFARLHAVARDGIARDIERAEVGDGPLAPAEALLVARANMALGNGFLLEGLLEPEIVAGESYERAAAALHLGLTSVVGRTTRRAVR